MILPEIINYILTLRYTGTESGRTSFVCYEGFIQVRIPMFPAGLNLVYTVRPDAGIFALLGYRRLIGTDMVPDAFSSTIHQYGARPFSGIITQISRDMEHPGFMLITERDPLVITVNNISPLSQKAEMMGHVVIIGTEYDLAEITDALRRLHTTTRSEQLLQQAVNLLGVLTGAPPQPSPSIGG